MANFDARIRSNFADIGGLVLDCEADTHEADDSGNVQTWTNNAPVAYPTYTGTDDRVGAASPTTLEDSTANWIPDSLVGRYGFNVTDSSWGTITGNTKTTVTCSLTGGTVNHWDTGDSYKLGVPRFGDLHQDTAANRPGITAVGGYNFLNFVSTSSTLLNIPLSNIDYPTVNMSIAFDLNFGTPTGSDWTICKFGGTKSLKIFAYDSGGTSRGWVTDVTTVSTTGNMLTDDWVFNNEDIEDGQAWKDGAKDTGLDGDMFFSYKSTGASVGVLGAEAAGTDHMDGLIRRMSIWRKELSDQEIALINDTYSTGMINALYAPIIFRDWTDGTGGTDLPSRINSKQYAPQKFYLARVAPGGSYVQIAGEIGGLSVPDTALNNCFFTLDCLEYPEGPPSFHQQSGWSSVWDAWIVDPGHYTFSMNRDQGGTVILHLDVEVAP